jgi:hypothetical protein
LIDALHIATSARSGDNPAEAEKTGEAILGPPAHMRRTLYAMFALNEIDSRRRKKRQKKDRAPRQKVTLL